MTMTTTKRITRMDREAVRILREAAVLQLQPVLAQFGIQVKGANGKFSETSCSITFDFSIIAPDGAVLTREAEDFKRYAHLYGMKPDHLGAEFPWAGNRFRITGLKAGRGTRFPILAERVRDGKPFKFGQEIARVLPAAPEPPAAAPPKPDTDLSWLPNSGEGIDRIIERLKAKGIA